jgi:photosystem II stability/assembly factor-like uncharacterized protein
MRHLQLGIRRLLPLAAVLGLITAEVSWAQAATGEAGVAAGSWQDPSTAPAEIQRIDRIDESLLLDATNSRDRAVVVGDRGHILVSESRSEWRQVPTPTRSMLTAVYAIDNTLWAVGHDQVIVYSSDGGLTWTLQNHNNESDGPLLDVLFLDGERGFAIGAYGQFLSTTDAGAHWAVEHISDRMAHKESASDGSGDSQGDDMDSEIASTDIGEDEGDPHLNAITMTAAGLIIVGEAGAAYRSVDRGEHWTQVPIPYEGSMFGAIALDNGTVVAFGLRGNAFSTSDLGTTWHPLQTGTEASLLGGSAVSGGRAVLVGASGTVLLLPANSDQLRGYVFSDGGVMSSVLPLGETEFLTIGENGLAVYQPN